MLSIKCKLLCAVFSLLFLISIILAYLNGIVKPILYRKAESEMLLFFEKNISTALSNATLTGMFDDLVHFHYDADGKICAYSANSSKCSYLRSYISERITESLDDEKSTELRISIGSLTGISLLYGRGPEISFELGEIGFVSFDIASEFTSAGINQTLHKITLNSEGVFSIKEPLSINKVSTKVNIPLAETVILGEVPEAYTVIIRAQAEEEGDINDYGAAAN